METSKKIITGIVGLVTSGTLVFSLGGDFISSKIEEDSTEIAQGLDFDTPELNEEKIEFSSKIEMYDKEPEEYDAERYDSLANNLSFLQKMEKRMLPKKEDPRVVPETKVDKQLEMIMALQSSIQNQGGNGDLVSENTPPPPVEVEKKVIPKEGSFFFGADSKKRIYCCHKN